MKRNKNLLPEGITLVLVNDVIDPVYVPSDSDFERILKEIFSVDPSTGLPQGDLAYYLSPSGNPQIKQWLENNLLKPRAEKVGTSIEGVTDDMLFEMSRGDNESVEDYALRLRSIYEESRKVVEPSTKLVSNE